MIDYNKKFFEKSNSGVEESKTNVNLGNAKETIPYADSDAGKKTRPNEILCQIFYSTPYYF